MDRATVMRPVSQGRRVDAAGESRNVMTVFSDVLRKTGKTGERFQAENPLGRRSKVCVVNRRIRFAVHMGMCVPVILGMDVLVFLPVLVSLAVVNVWVKGCSGF